MGVRALSTVGCCLECVFLFSLAQVLVGLQKQFINNFFPILGPVVLVLIIIIIIIIVVFQDNPKILLKSMIIIDLQI